MLVALRHAPTGPTATATYNSDGTGRFRSVPRRGKCSAGAREVMLIVVFFHDPAGIVRPLGSGRTARRFAGRRRSAGTARPSRPRPRDRAPRPEFWIS